MEARLASDRQRGLVGVAWDVCSGVYAVCMQHACSVRAECIAKWRGTTIIPAALSTARALECPHAIEAKPTARVPECQSARVPECRVPVCQCACSGVLLHSACRVERHCLDSRRAPVELIEASWSRSRVQQAGCCPAAAACSGVYLHTQRGQCQILDSAAGSSFEGSGSPIGVAACEGRARIQQPLE
eukprot:scaffold28807_cov67-Phaeocystis_antarctica.AAC.10